LATIEKHQQGLPDILPYTPCHFQKPVNRRCYLSRIHIKEIERIKKKKRRRRTNLFGLPPLPITL
jgi:hypothetical protein